MDKAFERHQRKNQQEDCHQKLHVFFHDLPLILFMVSLMLQRESSRIIMKLTYKTTHFRSKNNFRTLLPLPLKTVVFLSEKHP